MAHCNPCKSKLGTGGRRGMTFPVRISSHTGTGGRINAPVRVSAGGWFQPGTGLRSFRTGLQRRYMDLARVQQVSSAQWIPAVSTIGNAPEFYPYAFYTGGRYALLFADRTSSKRRVLESRNSGPSGLEVRLGQIVALEAGFGTGCNTCEMLLGTGGHIEEIAASRGLSPNECQVIYYDGQGYMCCGTDCVPLPITSDERSLSLPTTYTSAARSRLRRHW